MILRIEFCFLGAFRIILLNFFILHISLSLSHPSSHPWLKFPPKSQGIVCFCFCYCLVFSESVLPT